MDTEKQDTSTGRYELRGFPYWSSSPFDNQRTMKIKAAKNIISVIREWKTQGLDAVGNKIAQEDLDSYHQAIKILEEEGEKYP